VFCEVGDPTNGLVELRRVLRNAALLFMLEHVRPSGWPGTLASWLTRVIGPLLGEHLDRDAEAFALRAGFSTRQRDWLLRDVVVMLELRAPG
jgi:ubiquinone/menaquinone biosynthesis C-methylase UbiE